MISSTPSSAPFAAKKLAKAYPGHLALKNIDLEIPGGHVVGLLGRNGAGKTTLLNLACGLLLPTSGACTTLGRASWEPRQRSFT